MFRSFIIEDIEKWLKGHVPIGVTHVLSTIWTVMINFSTVYVIVSSKVLNVLYYDKNVDINHYFTVKLNITYLLTLATTIIGVIWYFFKLKRVKARTTPENYEDEAYDIVFTMTAAYPGLFAVLLIFTAIYYKFPHSLYTAFFIIEWVLVIPLYCFIVNRIINKKISQIYLPEPSAYPR